MIKEDYVSAEIARLLEKKGFNETCYACYEYFESGVTLYKGWMFEYKGIPVHNSSERIKCPTHQMVKKWLRVVHNIVIQTELYSKHGDYCFEIYKNTHRMIVEKVEVYNSYEKADEEAIKYCLENLI